MGEEVLACCEAVCGASCAQHRRCWLGRDHCGSRMPDWKGLGPKDQQRVIKLFDLIDADHDGVISFQEIRTANGGDPQDTMAKMFMKLDRNNDGKASLDEWITFWVSLHSVKGDRAFTKFLKSLAT